jgi:hypothetical protein
MSSETKFRRAMAAATPLARDTAFIVAVLERAEAARFRAHNARALLRGAGVAAGLAGPAMALLAVAPAQALAEGLLASAALAMFVLSVRRVAARA